MTNKTNARMKEIQYAKQVNWRICIGKYSPLDLQNAEERFKELENDKTRLDEDKSTIEKQLKETEGVRRNLFEKNQVNIFFISTKKRKNRLFFRSMKRMFSISFTRKKFSKKKFSISNKPFANGHRNLSMLQISKN